MTNAVGRCEALPDRNPTLEPGASGTRTSQRRGKSTALGKALRACVFMSELKFPEPLRSIAGCVWASRWFFGCPTLCFVRAGVLTLPLVVIPCERSCWGLSWLVLPAFASQLYVDRILFAIAVERVGTWVTLLDPSDVPPGMSPNLADVDFFPGGVRRAPASSRSTR